MKDTPYDMLMERQGDLPEDLEELRELVEETVLEWDFTKKQAKTLAEVRTTQSRQRLLEILYFTTIKGHEIKMKKELRSLLS